MVLGKLDSGLVIHRERNDDQQGDGGVAGGITRAERRMLAQHRARVRVPEGAMLADCARSPVGTGRW